MKKPFPIAAILSITTGRLLCPIGGVYEILNHITGDDLFTHALPRAGEFAQPLLLADHPELAPASGSMKQLDRWLKTDKTEGKTEFLKIWLTELKMMGFALPETMEIASYAGQWKSIDPAKELAAMMGSERMMVVSL